MAITLKGNGYSYAVPSSLDLRTFGDETEIGGIVIPGRDGIIINKNAIRKGSLRLTLSGLLTGTSTSDFESKFETLSQVVNSSPEPLVLNTGVRTIRVRKINMTHQRIPSGGTKMSIAITFISEDGYWQNSLPAGTNLGTFSGNPKAALKTVTIGGSYKTYPTILLKPTETIQDPTVTWYGRNLVQTSAFDVAESGGVIGSWIIGALARRERYANKYVVRVALNTAARAVQYFIPCNASTAYHFSAYAASDTAATAKIIIYWYTSAGVFLDDAIINYITTGTLTRFSATITSPATAAYMHIGLYSTVNDVYVYITDVQFEESATLSEYMPSQDVTFAITGNNTFLASDVLEIDCYHKTVRKWATATSLWTNIIDKSNAQFFHLNPGKNLLAIYQEAATGNMEVLVRYIDRYLGY